MDYYVHNIDPFIFTVTIPIIDKSLSASWYGLMYLIGMIGAGLVLKLHTKRLGMQWSYSHIFDLAFYFMLGVVIGGRLGYMLFYQFDSFIGNPLSLFDIQSGGMSFHGGLLGALGGVYVFARNQGYRFWCLMELVAVVVPIGLFTGRIGNFINGELWGGPTNVPWAMVFPSAGSAPRHPSMLYEAFLEGIVLFVILWLFARKPRPVLAVASLFTLLYGVFRIAVEFVRVPDNHVGYLYSNWLTQGMVLSLPMIIIGGALFVGVMYLNRPNTCLDNLTTKR